jgi:iron complex outermembrane receptor protein
MSIARARLGRAAGVLAAFATISVPALAQETGTSSTAGDAATRPTLEEIVVTADRRNSFSADLVQAGSFRGARQLDTPLTISVIPLEMIQAQQAQGLLDALRNTAGVTSSQTSPTVYSNLAIRGINVENRGNFRLNGSLPIINLIDLPLEDKDRVEALKGASALYYGFTTPAGIINLTMKRPTPDPYVALNVAGNQYGALTGHIDVGGTQGILGARVNAVYGTVDSGIDNTRGHRALLSGAFDIKPTDSLTLSLDSEYIYKTVNEPGVYRFTTLPRPTVSNPYPTVELPPLIDPTTNFGPDWAKNEAEEYNVLGTVNWKISDAWALTVSGGTSRLVRSRRFNTLNPLDLTTGEGTLAISLQPDLTFKNVNTRVELAGTFNTWFLTHEVLIGASQNVRDAKNSTSVAATCPGATPTAPRVTCTQNFFNPRDIPETAMPLRTGDETHIDDVGYYFFDRIKVTEWLQLLGGVRMSEYEESNRTTDTTTFDASPTSLSYGAVLKPLSWISVYGTYIEGLESTPGAPSTALNQGVQLPATESEQREAGIKIEPTRGLLLQAAYFEIDRASTYVNGANLYVQDGQASYEGYELSLSGEVTRDLSLYASALFLDAVQESGAPTVITVNPTTGAVSVAPTAVGKLIENSAKETWSIAGEYRLDALLQGFSFTAGAYHTGRRAVNSLNQAFAPGYTLYDAGFAYDTELGGTEMTFQVNAQNITNERYFASTGGFLLAQGGPRLIKFLISTKF